MFTEEQKRIFQYTINGEVRYADPLRIRRLLQIGTGGRFDEYAKLQREGSDVEKAEANGILADATSGAFGHDLLNPETGEGFTEGEMISLLCEFMNWIEQKKTSGET